MVYKAPPYATPGSSIAGKTEDHPIYCRKGKVDRALATKSRYETSSKRKEPFRFGVKARQSVRLRQSDRVGALSPDNVGATQNRKRDTGRDRMCGIKRKIGQCSLTNPMSLTIPPKKDAVASRNSSQEAGIAFAMKEALYRDTKRRPRTPGRGLLLASPDV